VVCAAVIVLAVPNSSSTCAPSLADDHVHQPNALCILQLHSHNSSSSSIFVSSILGAAGTLPSELPLSFCAFASVAPKLLRMPSSNPGREARCFLNGEPIVLSVLRSVTDVLGAADVSAVISTLETGVPEMGDPEVPRLIVDAT
jgi:hypothetical protein